MTKKKPKSEHKDAGRPTIMTKELVEKLEFAFMHGLTDEEACFYVDIDRGTLYNYCKANPDFSTRKELLKRSPVVTSKFNVVQSINSGNLTDSKFWLQAKCKEEFSMRTETTGKDGEPIQTVNFTPDELKKWQQVLRKTEKTPKN